jgi:putative ABC transport system substrate-binding protein
VVSDPVGEGFVATIARPGRNATGFTNAEASLTGKWLGLLKEMMPSIDRVAFIFDPKVAAGGGSYYTKLIEAAAPQFQVTPTALPIRDSADVDSAVGDFIRKPNGGLLVLPDSTTNFHRERIIAMAAEHRVPAVYAFRYIVADGGLMSYGVDVTELCRRAATYVDRILRGPKPADLPVQLPEKFQLVLNLKTAAAMGLTIPTSLQLLADEVIE